MQLARQHNHSYSLADVLAYGGCAFHEARADDVGFQRCAAELFQLVSTRGPFGWKGTGTFFYGVASARRGRLSEGLALIKESIRHDEAVGLQLYMPARFRILGSIYAANGQPSASLRAFEAAFTLIAETGEHHAEAELYRARAALWRGEGDLAAAETDLVAALDVARRQEAILWELRAAMDLADLWAETSRAAEGRALVAEVYARFTEGFDAPDLQGARLILGQQRWDKSGGGSIEFSSY